MLFAPVVLDVRDVSLVDGDELEDERLASTPVLGDPVEAHDERALASFDELVGPYSGVAGPLGGRFLLLLKDRPGLFRPLSAWCPPPPQEPVFHAPPDGVGAEERCQRLGISLVEGGVRRLDSLHAC